MEVGGVGESDVAEVVGDADGVGLPVGAGVPLPVGLGDAVGVGLVVGGAGVVDGDAVPDATEVPAASGAVVAVAVGFGDGLMLLAPVRGRRGIHRRLLALASFFFAWGISALKR